MVLSLNKILSVSPNLQIAIYLEDKKLYRAFSRQANGLTFNIAVLQFLIRVNGKAEKDA